MRFAALAAVFLLAACGGGERKEPAPAVSEPRAPVTRTEPKKIEPTPAPAGQAQVSVTVALLLPLTGAEADVGNALLDAATMAFYDAYDPRITLVPLDTKGTEEGARAAATLALDTHRASIILGPLLSRNVAAAGELAAQRRVPVIGFSNDRTVAAPGRYILGFLPETEVDRVIGYAAAQGRERFAAMIPYGRYGERVRTAFGDAVFDAGARVTRLESYESDAAALADPVKRLTDYDARRKARQDEVSFLRSLRDEMTDEIARQIDDREVLGDPDFDAVLLPEGGALLKTLAPLFAYYETDLNRVKLLGTGLWFDPDLLKEPPLKHGWFAAPDPTKADAFFRRYRALHGHEAPRLASLAYDAMALVASLMRDDADGRNFFTAMALTEPTGFAGVDGIFRLLPTGLNERGLAVLEIGDRGFEVIDPSPAAFTAPVSR